MITKPVGNIRPAPPIAAMKKLRVLVATPLLIFLLGPLHAEPQNEAWFDAARIDRSTFTAFQPNNQGTSDGRQPLLRILYGARRARSIAPRQVRSAYAAADPIATYAVLLTDRAAVPGAWFRVSGPLVRIREVPLQDAERDQYELDHLYRAEISFSPSNAGASQQDAADTTVVVYLARVPDVWRRDKKLPGTVACDGVFLAYGDEPEQNPVLVADRLAWHPPSRLGQLGMDVSLFDQVKNRTDLSPQDHDPFYALLHSVRASESSQLAAHATSSSRDVVPLFNEPDASHGRLVAISGTARSAKRVAVENEADRETYDIDHYFEVAVFTDSSLSNPIVCCVRELPPDMPMGPEINEHVDVVGFFFKVWRYPTYRPSDDAAGDQLVYQLAPLIIGPDLIRHPPTAPYRTPWLGAVAGAGFLVVLTGAWLYVWRSRRADRRAQQNRRARQFNEDLGM